jgi:hypothetical protein
MDKDGKTYKSAKVLGRMFRAIDPDPTFEPVSPTDIQLQGRFFDIHIAPAYMEKARDMKMEYDQDLTRLIRRWARGISIDWLLTSPSYELTSEVECVTGLTVRPKQRRQRKQRDHDREARQPRSMQYLL